MFCAKNKMKLSSFKKTIPILFFGVLFVVGLFFYHNFVQGASSDAIAIRVIPNPNHYSALSWYKSRDFKGSPQSLTVDGYEAVRDGRTVYVNVANIDDSSGIGVLYTNIYLISYNQDAVKVTTDIFGQILSHWKFNSNLIIEGRCQQNSSKICFNDNECPAGDFCTSHKARVTRDVRRLADMAFIKELLENRGYPELNTGTYLPNKTISVWPSWRETFSRELGATLPVDPINKLGECLGFNETTCWNEITKEFVSDLPDLVNNSLAYTYDGTSGSICVVLESGFSIGGESVCSLGVCIDNDGDGYGMACVSGLDCNDSDSSIHAPTGQENITVGNSCCDDIDNDCDGFEDCYDTGGLCHTAACCVSGGECIPGTERVCGTDTGVCETGISTCDSMGNWSANCAGAVIPLESPETSCDGFDNDCDGDVDEGLTQSCYTGDSGTENIGVCHGGTWECTAVLDSGVASWGSCNGEITPSAAEVCDGFDNDCDGQVDEDLEPDDCEYTCISLSFDYNPYRNIGLMCCGDDMNEAGPFESVESVCDDGHDNDCDGTWDNDITNPATPDTDCLPCDPGAAYGEAFMYWVGTGDCDQCDNPGDQDGDQETLGGLIWTDEYSSYPGLADQCDRDCNPSLPNESVHIDDFEHNNETRCDNIDNDCDGEVDEGCDDDGDGYCDEDLDIHYINKIKTGIDVCINSTDDSSTWDCDDTNSDINPGESEICANGIDDNCTGGVDEGCITCYRDLDNDGYGNSLDTKSDTICDADWVENNTDCDDSIVTGIYCNPGLVETCDNLDNDCSDNNHSDGVNLFDIDNGCDDDNDNYCDEGFNIYYFNTLKTGIDVCTNSTDDPDTWDCNDANFNINPGESEICGNGLDEDCSGSDDICACTPSLTCMDYAGQCGVNLSNGCENILDCSGNCSGGQICCSGACSVPTCSSNGDCDGGNVCSVYTCNNAGTCTAYCSASQLGCNSTTNDGCCPSSCSSNMADTNYDLDCSNYCEFTFEFPCDLIP